MPAWWTKRRNPSAAPRRRSGPVDEEPWWDPDDQRLAEQPLLDGRALGRGWSPIPMLNNTEHRNPFGDDSASAVVAAARAARRPTALDEGQAWRHRDQRALVVLRCDVFADPDQEAHRAVWKEQAETALEATWRARWRERHLPPGWVEARWRSAAELPGLEGGGAAEAVDWLRIEDHTAPDGDGSVTVYEHLTVWAGRPLVTVTVRHALGLDLDDLAGRAAATVHRRLSSQGSRPPDGGSRAAGASRPGR